MKHLRKIFESTKEDQHDEIESIFIELLDQTYAGEDGEYYSNCEISSRDNFILISIYDSQSKVIINSFDDYDKFTKESEERVESLKKLKKYLQRIDYAGFKWDMEIDEEGYFIKVYYKDAKLSLIDVFGGEFGHKNFDETVAKRVFRESYGLEYNSLRYDHPTGGYYGKRATYYLYFKKAIPNDSKIQEDLRKLKQKYKYFTTAAEGEQIGEKNIIYTTELIHDGRTLKIELHG
jgi:hypothetical protein